MTNTDYYNPPDKHYLVRDDIIPYWEGDKITSDVVPSMNNDNGIYVSKKINPNILTPYSKDNVLVKIRVWGNIVEHDYTIRAEKAEILGIIK